MTQVQLNPEHELRLEVQTQQVAITLVSGTAEVFGAELAVGHCNIIPSGSKIAVFSWHGCVLEVVGKPDVMYVANETPMRLYQNIHTLLEQRRQAARETGGRGPRVLVAGPCDSGKSTLCRILVNYAVRTDCRPIYADLDVGQGAVVLPGTIVATPVTLPVTVDESFPMSAPLVFSYGSASMGSNPDYFTECLQHMATKLNSQCDSEPDFRTPGLIINTCGWVEGVGYKLLKDSIEKLSADVVLVLGDERLYSQLAGELTGQNISVVKLHKSGGVVNRDPQYRRQTRMSKIREYFYGEAGNLSPDYRVLNFSDVALYRIGGGQSADSSCLPIGAESVISKLTPQLVVPGPELKHAVLAVSYAESADHVLSSNIAGFIIVQEIDVANQRMTVLAPSPGNLPNNVLIIGDIKWVEG